MSQIAQTFVVTPADIQTISQIVAKGKQSARTLNRARVLQFSHQGQRPQQVSALLGISVATVYNIRKRYQNQGLQAALTDKARPGQPRKGTPVIEAEITRMACTPDGRTRWTVDLINKELVKLAIHIDDESVRLVLKKVSLSPGSRSSGASGRLMGST